MWHTLGYDQQTHTILVGGKYWSDFGGHLPQIRSFSKGLNWPPVYPLYPGEPIRYHFLFFALVGLLEKSGLRIDYALNIPSALGLFALCMTVFMLSKKLFKSDSTAYLSVIFLLFNGSFSWLDYLKNSHYSLAVALSNLGKLTEFPSFAPWNKSEIAAFWNLNIYSNQRHLGLSFAVVISIIYILFSSNKKYSYLIGFLLGLLLVLNQAAFVVAAIYVGWLFVFRSNLRTQVFMSMLGAIPWILLSLYTTKTSPFIAYHPGFLQQNPITFLTFARYWILNFGLHFILIPLGFVYSKRSEKILFPPLLIIFILSNTFQFSVDPINNHKFFNFFLILGGMYSAHFLSKVKFSLVLLPLLVLGGVVDLFPVKNDVMYKLMDYKANADIRYFIEHTEPNAVVLNSTWFYHPASLAGRAIFNGYSYFTWSFGYDQTLREKQTIEIYQSPTKLLTCKLLEKYHIQYVELNRHPEMFIRPNLLMWENEFKADYVNTQTGIKVFSVTKNCS